MGGGVFLKLDPGLRQILRTPKRILEVSRADEDGQRQVKVLAGYRVPAITTVARGPGKAAFDTTQT